MEQPYDNVVPLRSWDELRNTLWSVEDLSIIDFDFKSMRSFDRLWDDIKGRDARILFLEDLNRLAQLRHSVKVIIVDPGGGILLETKRVYRRRHLKNYSPEERRKRLKKSRIKPIRKKGIKPWAVSETSKKIPENLKESESGPKTAHRAIQDEELRLTLDELGISKVDPAEFRELGTFEFPRPPRESDVYYRFLSIVYERFVLWRPSFILPDKIVVKNDGDTDVTIERFLNPPDEIHRFLQLLLPGGILVT